MIQILMKYKKETTIVIAVAIVVLGRQLRLQDIKKNIEIHNTVQQEIIENEDLKEKPQNSVDYNAWIEYREKKKRETISCRRSAAGSQKTSCMGRFFCDRRYSEGLLLSGYHSRRKKRMDNNI